MMSLVFKFMCFLTLLCFGDITIICILENLGMLSILSVVIVVIFTFILIFYVLNTNLLKPLGSLYDALDVINFDNDIIDFSKLDTLNEVGTKEIKTIIYKFKYLLDIIAERINKINSTSYKAEHDALTGCFNKLHLNNVKSTYEFSKFFTVIFIDVNNLKKMNDIFGHEAGDALLKTTAQKLNFWNNYGDVYRLGGDEFMIVITNKRPEYVMNLISHWYPTVGQLNRDSDGFKCVLSYGVAHGTQGYSFDAIQKLADDEMYKMKVELKKKFGEPMR